MVSRNVVSYILGEMPINRVITTTLHCNKYNNHLNPITYITFDNKVNVLIHTEVKH